MWYNRDVNALREWLNTECEQRNLSWREASIKAGLYAGSISAIMNGQRPGLETCKALAQAFGVPTEKVLQMAGFFGKLKDCSEVRKRCVFSVLGGSSVQEIGRLGCRVLVIRRT